MIPIDIHDQVHKDLLWLQSEYQKGINSQYYAKANRENKFVIDALARLLLKKKYMQKNKSDIENMIQQLHNYYG